MQFYITVGYLPADAFAEGVVPFIAGYHIIESMCHLRNGYGATDQDATMMFYLVLDAVATLALDEPALDAVSNIASVLALVSLIPVPALTSSSTIVSRYFSIHL